MHTEWFKLSEWPVLPPFLRLGKKKNIKWNKIWHDACDRNMYPQPESSCAWVGRQVGWKGGVRGSGVETIWQVVARVAMDGVRVQRFTHQMGPFCWNVKPALSWHTIINLSAVCGCEHGCELWRCALFMRRKLVPPKQEISLFPTQKWQPW